MALETKRKLIKFSNYSFCITLPKEAVDVMGWKKGETLQVTFDDRAGKIVVSKGKNKSQSQPAESMAKPIPINNGANGSISGDIQPIPKLRW